MSMTFTTDLAAVRARVSRCAREAGLSDARIIDLVLAAGEITANTVRHTHSAGTLDVWHDASEIVCEVKDKGFIRDPLAGTRRPAADALHGHGLWLVRRLCDRVEIRSDETGSTIRLYMFLGK